MAVPQRSSESGQIGQFRRSADAAGWFGCPIVVEQLAQMPAAPKARTQHREQPGKTVRPGMQIRQITQQQMHQQSDPDLPAHGVGVVAKEVRQLQGLLDLLEEHLDVPAAAIQLGHRPGAPRQAVRQERQLDILAVHFDPRHDPPQRLRVRQVRLVHGQFDDLVGQNARVVRRVQPLDPPILKVILRPGHPPDPAPCQVEEMPEIDVRLVKYGDFAAIQRGADLPRPTVVVILGRIDDGASRQKRLQIQPQVALGRRLAPTVFRPVHAVGHQLNRGRVHRVNHFAKAAQESATDFAACKARRLRHQMVHHPPVQRLRHRAVSLPIRVAEGVAARRRRPPNRRQHPGVHPQRIAHVVQADRVRQLRMHQRHRVAPRQKGATLLVHPVLLRYFRHQAGRNQIAQLLQHGVTMPRWNVSALGFHPCRVAGADAAFQLFLSEAVG